MRTDAARRRIALARVLVGAVFVANLSAAIPYLVNPAAYARAFELSGVPGMAMVRGLAVLFLMWNATYPLVILDLVRPRALFGVILAQQVIGLVGEIWILASLPPGHAALAATGLRFVIFDGLGLVLLAIAFGLTRRSPG